MTKFGDKTVLHVHVQVTSSFSQPLYCQHFFSQENQNPIRNSLYLCLKHLYALHKVRRNKLALFRHESYDYSLIKLPISYTYSASLLQIVIWSVNFLKSKAQLLSSTIYTENLWFLF